MPKLIALEAVRPFNYHGRQIDAGDCVDVAPLEAAHLIASHDARFVKKRPQAKRRTYKRRDLVAEQ